MFKIVIGIGCLIIISVLFAWVFVINNRPRLSTHWQQLSNGEISLPLFYDSNGVFVTDIVVGSQALTVVIDTGSSHLVVGSYKCTKCFTDEKACIKKENMPSDTAIVLANDIITYGSQQDTLDWYVDQIQFPVKYHNDHVCVN